MSKPNNQSSQTKEFTFTHVINCPNCPIACYSYKGAIAHAEKCNERRRNGLCCLCKENPEKPPNPPDYYSPDDFRFWHICAYCYNWCKQKGLCL